MRFGKLSLLSAAVLILPSFAVSQNPSAPAAPTIRVYSRETIVDVLVTDDKGQPVRGLTKSDFTIEEDNKSQPIRSFHEYDMTTPPTPARSLPLNTYTNDNTLPANGPVQVFLFDLLGSAPEDIQRSKQYFAKYFRTMPAGTQVAIFEFSPSKGTVLLQGFTTDGKLAAAAVSNLDDEWIHTAVYGDPIGLAGMNQIAAYVAGIHGRKNLMWVIPHVPTSLIIARDGGLSWGAQDMTTVHRLMDLYDLFTREQIAIYPLDPRGVHDLKGIDGLLTLRDQNVADDTGGAISNSNDYQGTVANIIDETSHAYTISYVPPRPDEDGHFHPIKIKVDRPNVHLSYRTGYNDEQPGPPDPILKQQMIQGPMRLGALPSTQILFDLHVELSTSSAQPAHAKTAPYNTTYTLDPTQIALTGTPDGTRTANIELDLGAYDFYGKLVAARSQTFKFTVTPEQYAAFYRKPINLSLPIDLPHGQLTLHAGVFDTSANRAGTVEIPLTVPKK
jgi:VWFA-related protein